jgi:Mg-chelatase subunit ChlD
MEDTPKQNEQKKEVEILILKGDKLFNENTPFVINLLAPESKEQEEKRVSADLICVIDISGSMGGEKISLVKESLKILVDMMDQKDRIALVLFESQAKLLYDIDYLTPKNKTKVKDLINNIYAGGGTNIASGLEIAVEILKKQKENKTIEEGRSSSIILLSDGQDNNMDDTQLGDKLKSLTKGEGLSFTLNTFGYGYDHDPKIMNKLANLRDGSFFVVEDYNKVGEYFVTVL